MLLYVLWLRGLNYLHTRPDPVIHRDLKCDNIFINGAWAKKTIPKAFLCLCFLRKSWRHRHRGPGALHNAEGVMCKVRRGRVVLAHRLDATGLLWGQSTSLHRRSTTLLDLCAVVQRRVQEKYGTAVDIYAFGMVLLEMIGREQPWSECELLGLAFMLVMPPVLDVEYDICILYVHADSDLANSANFNVQHKTLLESFTIRPLEDFSSTSCISALATWHLQAFPRPEDRRRAFRCAATGIEVFGV